MARACCRLVSARRSCRGYRTNEGNGATRCYPLRPDGYSGLCQSMFERVS